MNGMTFRQLECFLEACRDFHFSKAAQRLNLAQPPFSRHIRELETTVGAKLFERSTKSVALTQAGELFLKETFAIPSQLSRAVDAARRAASGETRQLRIGFVGALFEESLMSLFRIYRSQNPNVQLSLADASPKDLVSDVRSGRLDGAFLGIKPTRPQAKLASLRWRSEPLYVCLPKDHRLASKRRLVTSDVVSENWISLSRNVAPYYRGTLEAVYQGSSRRPQIIRETTGVTAMLGMVVAGIGLALLPKSAITAYESLIATRRLHSKAARIDEVFVYRADDDGESLNAFRKLIQ